MTHRFDTQAFVRRMESAGMARRVAEELADALAAVVLDGLAPRRDVAARTDCRFREAELRLRQDFKERERRVTVRMGAMTAATIAIIGGLIAFR